MIGSSLPGMDGEIDMSVVLGVGAKNKACPTKKQPCDVDWIRMGSVKKQGGTITFVKLVVFSCGEINHYIPRFHETEMFHFKVFKVVKTTECVESNYDPEHCSYVD